MSELKLFNRDDMLFELKEHVAEVTFKKVDGQTRVMRCTLRRDILPKNYDPDHLDQMHHKEENKDIIAVWDLDKQGWRSFRVENVQWVQVLANY